MHLSSPHAYCMPQPAHSSWFDATNNILWGLMRRADKLTTFMCHMSWNLAASTSWNPQGLSRPVQGLLYLYRWWSRGERAGLWYPSSRVQTRPKPLDFPGEKILSAPSFGGEVKPSVPCSKLTARKRTQKWRGSRHFRQNSRKFLAHSSTFARVVSDVRDTWWRELERSNHWSSKLGVWRAAGNGTL